MKFNYWILFIALTICGTLSAQNKESYDNKKVDKKKARSEQTNTTTTEQAPSKVEIFEYALPVYDIKQQKVSIRKGTFNGFLINIPNGDVTKVADAWSKMMRKAKAKTEGDYSEMLASQAVVKSLGKTPMDIYAKFKIVGNGVEVTSMYQVSEGEFISATNNPDLSLKIEKMLKKFALQFEERHVSNMLKNQKRVLSGYERELNKLKREEEKSKKKLAEYEAGIIEMKDNIEASQKMQLSKKEKIDGQEQVVKNIEKMLKMLKKN